ncbi:VacJ family lipoprotein [Ruegeria pomeroyi]|jgi:phospholipid-binding lipoprotein MlaA|uniref:VacJ lipoprotein, putative n=2 Tax=Ruegeria pomeroyi TaxID=89184 RepID=Q5LM37_RUEPO|nr:VacJ family lipoprotein [Ruegeria pomeroyi]HCE72773.1 VacJ family lipoprotein [Ruegeria sp.]AAV96948.1 VacJ lipoprotein, putative [Ruegeria pomeroyi DSS-3]NVK97994.1 VacJ family lipoprotein [Ruegeria pomeroyi]NVL02433.1 VacJ family lipoprotein [Ruegeria pomeroyi]QWV10477.1 VacJ family lipoprotein [Ruegeria pomeroyi]
MSKLSLSIFRFSLVAISALLSACAGQSPDSNAGGRVHDPYENTNRAIHNFNRGVDKALFRPAAKGYVTVVPRPMVNSFNMFAENLSLPGQAVDYLLQGKPKEMGTTLFRFVVNSTVGFAGLADPASDFEIPRADTDFGETLHVWGVAEGPYLELPLYGPSTARDAVGVVVNLFTNPVDFAPTRPINNLGLYAEVVRRLGDRGLYSDTVDSILYGSSDSYAQLRLIYLQNRRFELASDDEDAYLGLYTDPYAEPSSAAVTDPYEDPYAE